MIILNYLVGLLLIVMDSSSQATNFMDLLSSQTTPISLYGSSDVPICTSQCNEAASLPENFSAERRERIRWTSTEDILLISSWLNTSKDAVVGNEQKSGTFWKRIASYYAEIPLVVGGETREPGQCKQRWQKINDLVGKFCGSYEAAKREKTSGQNENDVIKLAHQIFFNNHKKKFTLEHAWNELRNDQKWCEVSIGKTDGNCKRRRCDDVGQSCSSQTVSNVEGETTKRPLGVKAAKGFGKKSVEAAKALSDLQSMWTIKEKDLIMKEKLSKISLLDTLLGKKEPLSEVEEALKNKLITEMLSN